ncbi:alcohol dehydrogenase catalytic domain-containing protein [Corynebacterium sp. TA-R-1]|uniref:Alcohol dehydrogenase catalytic domain-containing protein n=1 Tax=Corynebacterium stercoris TaxID=2943490 RepID=A0ABT1G5N9_9CORY|nr:alcohol dehydrogenase catalytic domain-containing protein [Corynebacterium stercoris]MCP1388323.1 alcohol dehydrogenase catalytic domain-containing protein [Corynebacterium stercoris]
MAHNTITITGAVLEDMGSPEPYADSRPLTVCELELMPPGPGEVLVKILATGICHSDLSVVNGSRPRPVPMLLGHETAGVVQQVGEGVTDFAPGDRVVCIALPHCGECAACATGGTTPCEPGSNANVAGTLLSGERRILRDGQPINHHLGISGFATHAVMDTRSIAHVGADVPPEIAATFGCAIMTGGGAVLNEVKPNTDTTLAIVGLGGVGIGAALTAAALGVKEIVGIDLQDNKREFALELGCTEVMTPDEALASGRRFSAAIEAAGHPAALETAFAVTDRGGLTLALGLPAPGSVSRIDPTVLATEARTLRGSYLGSCTPARDIPRFEQLWREGKLHAEKLISARIALTDINEAMDNLHHGLALRQVIVFEE